MSYVFKCSTLNEDGSVTIPKESVERWLRQMRTPYEELSETEKDSDRKEADQYIRIVLDAELNEFDDFVLDPNDHNEYIYGDSYPIVVKGGKI